MAKKKEDPFKAALQKSETVDDVIKIIRKKHGNTSIQCMGDGPAVLSSDDVISTGSFHVDRALGIGGFPKGRIVEIYGPEGGGKCLTSDSLCLSEHGLLTITELFNKLGHETFCVNKVCEAHVELLNEDGKLENTSHITFNNKRKIFNIKTNHGFSIKVTGNHPLKVLHNGYLVWKKAKNIKSGDTVAISRGHNLYGSKTLTEHEARFLGYIIADGTLSYQNRTAFTNSDPEVVKLFTKDAALLGAPEIKQYGIDYHINSQDFRTQLYKDYLLDYVVADGKEVPLCIRSADENTQRNFLKGYFELECSIHPESTKVEVISASSRLMQQIQLILLNKGILSTIRPKWNEEYKKTYHRLSIRGQNCIEFCNWINFDTTERQNKVSQLEAKNANSTMDAVPGLSDQLDALIRDVDATRETWKLVEDYIGPNKKSEITHSQLRKCMEHLEQTTLGASAEIISRNFGNILQKNYLYEKVDTVEEFAEEPTFDVVMPNTHSFIANGFVNHNTTLAVSVIAACQKAGGKAGFIDAEHALDGSLVTAVGADLKNLFVSQPDYGEQGLDILQMMLESKQFDIVVVDSVAALTPKAEIEGEMEDQHMGIQARMMGKALRKITGLAAQAGTLVIFINQIRMKIGVMFGSPETTPGGNALKFFTSIRLDIRRIGAVKDKEDIIGNKVKVKILKNKLAPPFKTIETELIFGHGFNKEGELLEMAREMDVIELAGSRYKYSGQEFANGKAKASEALRTDPTLFASIASEVMKDAEEEKPKKAKKLKKKVKEDEYDEEDDEEFDDEEEDIEEDDED